MANALSLKSPRTMFSILAEARCEGKLATKVLAAEPVPTIAKKGTGSTTPKMGEVGVTPVRLCAKVEHAVSEAEDNIPAAEGFETT